MKYSSSSARISFSFVDGKTIAKINSNYVGHVGVTDVISFGYEGEGTGPDDVLAEIIVCADKAVDEGEIRTDSSYEKELVLYLVHGLLHIAGKDDLTPSARREMRRCEKKVINELEKEFEFSKIFPCRNFRKAKGL